MTEIAHPSERAVANVPGPAAPSPARHEWRVTVDGISYDLIKLERLAQVPGNTKEFVLEIDDASGEVTNMDVLERGARRALTQEEYSHVAALYMTAYMYSLYGEYSEDAAKYWKAYYAGFADLAPVR